MARNTHASLTALLLCSALLVSGCNVPGLGTIFLPNGDNEVACQTISPGGQIAVRVAYRGQTVTMNWNTSAATLDRTSNIEKLILTATNPTDGFVIGDTNANFALVLQREGGIAIADDYRDTPVQNGVQPGHFDVAISSDTSVTGIPIGSGLGAANVTQYSRSGTIVTTRIGFTVTILNLVTGTLESICGEAFYDGPVTVLE